MTGELHVVLVSPQTLFVQRPCTHEKTDTTKINRGYSYGGVVCSFACVPFCMEPGHGHGDHCFFFQTPFVDCKRCSHKKA